MSAVWLDLFGVIILGFNVLRGLSSGLIRTSLGAMAMVLASFAAWQHPEWAGFLVDRWVPPTWKLALLARPLVIWVAVFVLVNLLGIFMRGLIRVTPLVVADRIGGALFGLCIGLMVLLTPMLLIANFPLLQQIGFLQDLLARSVLAQGLSPLVQLLMHLDPALNAPSG